MTEEEIFYEQQKAVYHWLGLLESLRKLQNADVLDMNTTLEQLTNPALLQQINHCLSENPKLLELDKYLTLRSLLGRDLYSGTEYVPIETAEIEKIAGACNQDPITEDTEE